MLLAAVGFSSCENDDDDLYDTLTGRVWAGDLGFYQDGYALDSYVYFGADGFGSDELRYADNGRLLDTLNIQWDAYDDTVYIDYGRVDLPRELRRVHIRRGMLTADLLLYSAPRTLAESRGAFVWNGGCNSCCGRFRVTRPSPARRRAGR